MIPEFFISLFIWVFIWILGWSIFYLFTKKGIDYINKFHISSIYFLLISIIIIYFFRENLSPLVSNFTIIPFIFLAIVFIFRIFLYYLSNKYLKKPKKLIKENPDEYFLRFNYKYLTSKTFEILFQQVMIVLLILIISQRANNLIEIIVLFAVFFSLVHLPLFKITEAREKVFDVYFTISALVSAIIFPTLILNINYGFVYAYAAHLLFYTFSGIFFWIRNTLPKG